MFRANETNFKDRLKMAVRYHNGYEHRNKRTHWWTHHPLEFAPSSSLPAPHTLLCNYDLKWYDPSIWVLDLSRETVLGDSTQLEPIDLSFKTIPEFKQTRSQASEFLKMLLSSDDKLKVSRELEIVPFYPGQKTERRLQVSQYKPGGQSNNRTSCSASPSAVSPSFMHVPHRSPCTLPQKGTSVMNYLQGSTENVTNKEMSALAKNAGKKSQTLRLLPPPPEPPVQSSPRVVPDPRDMVKHVKFLEQNYELYKNLVNQQETPSKTAESHQRQSCYGEKSNNSTNSGFVNSRYAGICDPAMIRRSPIKRNQTGNSSEFMLSSAVPQHASKPTVGPGRYHGYTTRSTTRSANSLLYSTPAGQPASSSHMLSRQPYAGSKVRAITPSVELRSYSSMATSSAAMASRPYSRSTPSTRAVNSPLNSTPARQPTSSSHMMSRQPYAGFKVRPITPSAALQSYPSLASSATSSSAAMASRPYSRTNVRFHPYPSLAPANLPSRTFSVSKPPPAPKPFDSKTTTRIPHVCESTRSAKRDDYKSVPTFTTEDFKRAYSSLHERFLKQHFAGVIENPEASRGCKMAPGLSRQENSGGSPFGKQT